MATAHYDDIEFFRVNHGRTNTKFKNVLYAQLEWTRIKPLFLFKSPLAAFRLVPRGTIQVLIALAKCQATAASRVAKPSLYINQNNLRTKLKCLASPCCFTWNDK